MLDLNKFGVCELSLKEQEEVEGGWLLLIWFVVGVLIGLVKGSK